MIDVKELKTRYDEIAKNIKDRNMNVDLDKIVKDQEERAALLLEVENLRSKRNETAQKMKQKLDNETRQLYIQEGKEIKEALAEKEARLTVLDEQFKKEVMTIPNYASPLRQNTMSSLERNWISWTSTREPRYQARSSTT